MHEIPLHLKPEDRVEDLNTPEVQPRYNLKKSIVISGHPGTGKTRIINELGTYYGLQPAKIIKVGDLLRQKAKEETGKHVTGFYERGIGADAVLDTLQMDLFESFEPGNIYILESKLGGRHVAKLRERWGKDGIAPADIVTFLLFADPDIREPRVYKRDRKKKPDLTAEESRRETQEREMKDREQWTKLYHELENIDPLSPEAGDLYDHCINTSDLSVEEVKRLMHLLLLSDGAVERVKPIRKIPDQAQVFPTAS
ncbi:MAG: hypothetical protein HYT10_02590 [Candidatus Levybacteria bacterium]|nr:hypothetical protein [Candidatus Levybacteria bacterium]